MYINAVSGWIFRTRTYTGKPRVSNQFIKKFDKSKWFLCSPMQGRHPDSGNLDFSGSILDSEMENMGSYQLSVFWKFHADLESEMPNHCCSGLQGFSLYHKLRSSFSTQIIGVHLVLVLAEHFHFTRNFPT